MKFNRLELIARLEGKSSKAEEQYESDLAKWEALLAAWQRETSAAQIDALRSVGHGLLELATSLEVTPHKLEYKELKIVPDLDANVRGWRRHDDTDLDELVIAEPSDFEGFEKPRKPTSDTGLTNLLSALKFMLDEEVTTSGLERLGYQNVLKAWL
jgi:hypothetical protein